MEALCKVRKIHSVSMFTLCIHIEETLFEVKSTEVFSKNSKRNQFLFNYGSEKERSNLRTYKDRFFFNKSRRDYYLYN